MARGPSSPVPIVLPKVSFVKVEDAASTQPAGVHDQQARSFGYNDFSHFHRPEPYIRYIEPLESELAVQVEYDMDEQDQEWLDAVNLERKHDQLNKVTYETFEIIMDRLEKEWFDLTKNIPKPDMALPSEDSTCAICDEAEGENSNAIVFCDGCNLAVHQDCYGVPYIPEGQWLCRKCTVSPENPPSCILCPNEGGAFKQTVLGHWVHLLCAIWVPETRVANEVFMEPVTGVDRINKQRWKLKCNICGIREGACIQCMKASCFLAFHATCARKHKLLMPMKSYQSAEHATLTCYCEKHLPKEQQTAHQEAVEQLQEEEGATSDHTTMQTPRTSKTARAYAKTFKIGPPLVPAIIVRKIVDYIGRVNVRKKIDFVQLVCRYWSLKREARRGAPLLKRLHLEPWTASASAKPQTDEEKLQRLQHLQLLRKDLETVRLLADVIRKREMDKLNQAQITHDLFSASLFPHQDTLRLVLEKIMSMDRHDFYKNPVSKIDVPDYFDIIKEPMCWNTIDRKLDANQYGQLDDFRRDINLVLNNAMTYNGPDLPLHKLARKIKIAAEPMLKELDSLRIYHSAPEPALKVEEGTSIGGGPITVVEDCIIGDLEPPLSVLQLFLSTQTIASNTDFILDKDPLESLFSYEFARLKPPPPPPPPKPKRVRDRQAEKERRKAREEARKVLLDSSPGFRAPGHFTRRTRAAAAAFESEADPSTNAAEAESSEPSRSKGSKKGTRWRRPPLVLPGQANVPPVVDDVDNQRSFKMFDEGWILPEGQRRGGRPAIERREPPPPRKRARTGDRPKSIISKYNTPASENQTLHEADRLDEPAQQGGDIPREMMSPLTDPMDVDRSGQEDRKDVKEEVVPVTAVEFVLEELDTPATRRAKNMARKRQKREEALKQKRGRPVESEPMKGATTVSEPDASDLSSLSSLEDSDEDGNSSENDGTASPDEAVVAVRAELAATDPGTIVLGKGQALEGGTLVWAKAETYPWWPAVVFEEDDDRIPRQVKKEKKDAKARYPEGPLHLVQFYDKRHSWQWLGLEHLKLLGESTELDANMVSGSRSSQRFKSVKVRHECRAAYRKATAEMENPDGPDETEEGQSTALPTETDAAAPLSDMNEEASGMQEMNVDAGQD